MGNPVSPITPDSQQVARSLVTLVLADHMDVGVALMSEISLGELSAVLAAQTMLLAGLIEYVAHESDCGPSEWWAGYCAIAAENE